MKKKKKILLQQPQGHLQTQGTQASTALAPAPVPLLLSVTFSLEERPRGRVPVSVAALGRRQHLLHHQGGSRPTLHRPVCRLAANTSRPASTGIPNRQIWGPGGSGMELISRDISLLIKS